MSNNFKPNSRFAALADEITETKKNNMRNKNANSQNQSQNQNIQEKSSEGNIFKRNHPVDDRPRRTFDNRNSKEQIERRLKEEQIRKEKEKEREHQEKIKNLNPDNFPDLLSITIEKQEVAAPSMNFSDKLKNTVVKQESNKAVVDLEYEDLKPGWALSKKDLKTGKIITKYKESLTPKPREKTQREIGLDIINALVELHKKRTQEYIDMWGYDTWEKMYRFPNYDYEYFDKLDELYEEMENEENDENTEGYSDNEYY
jgi:hypothetical protein